MLGTISGSVMHIAVQVAIVAAGAAVTAVSAMAAAYLQKKRIEAVLRIDVDKYNYERQIAVDIYYYVEQYFKNAKDSEGSEGKKREIFESEILKTLPYLTSHDISRLRESIAGTVNSKRKDSAPMDKK